MVLTPASRRLLRDALWSLAGVVVPMLAAVLAVPWLLQALGQERLGVLSLVWVLVGYFSFLDLGLGRALTVEVARQRARPDADPALEAALLRTAGQALTVLGGAGLTAVLVVLALDMSWVAVSSLALREEVRLAMGWVALSLPLLLLSSGWRGYLEGVGAFRDLNLLRMPAGVLLVAAPCLVAVFSPSLVWSCLSIVLVRAVYLAALGRLVARERRRAAGARASGPEAFQRGVLLRRLFNLGGWMTVSNVLGPVIVYVDRFVMAALLGAGAVAAYGVPFDLLSRLPVLVAALCSVLLPELARLSALAGRSQAGAALELQRRVTQAGWLSAGLALACAGLGIGLTPWALELWLGAEFAAQSAVLTQVLWLAFGVNAMAQAPFTALQSAGRVRALALLHGAEILPYALLVAWLMGLWGVEGAAWACLGRSVVDFAALWWLWHRVSAQPVGLR